MPGDYFKKAADLAYPVTRKSITFRFYFAKYNTDNLLGVTFHWSFN